MNVNVNTATIDVVTTRRKLTTTLIKQMWRSTTEDLDHGTCLGYIRGSILPNAMYPILLIENKGKYTMVSTGWTYHGDNEITLHLPKRRSTSDTFKTKEEAKKYVDLIAEIYGKADQVYI